MDMTIIGFLKADGRRLRILETLNSRSSTAARQISHRLRINPRQTEGTLNDLLEKGLIKADETGYLVTDEGAKVLAQVSRAGM